MKYVEGINQALHKLMEEDDKVFLIGGGVSSPFYAGQSIKGLLERFGEERVIDTPVSENSVTGVAIGAALTGMRPILMFPRMDFMWYAMDQLINNASLMEQIYDYKLPLTVWSCINRGGEQGAQHSQALQGVFTHVPGFKVYMPTFSESAKDLLVKAVNDDSLVLYIDDRWLYNTSLKHKESKYEYDYYGKTVVTTSYMYVEAQKMFENQNIELINIEILKPLDVSLIVESIKKTGKLTILEGAWGGGFSSQLVTKVLGEGFHYLDDAPEILCLPDCHAPASSYLEKQYYNVSK